MTCTQCGGDTRVTDSRTAASSAKGLTGNLRATGEQLVHWYTQDWVVRRRKCTTCAHASTTIELHAEDFRAIVKEGLPDDE